MILFSIGCFFHAESHFVFSSIVCYCQPESQWQLSVLCLASQTEDDLDCPILYYIWIWPEGHWVLSSNMCLVWRLFGYSPVLFVALSMKVIFYYPILCFSLNLNVGVHIVQYCALLSVLRLLCIVQYFIKFIICFWDMLNSNTEI